MIAAIIAAAKEAADSVTDMLASNAEANAGTSADGTMNYGAYSKGMNKAMVSAALTNPTKLLGMFSQKKAMKRKIEAQKMAYNANTINTNLSTPESYMAKGGKVKDGDGKTSSAKGGQIVGSGGPTDDAVPATLNSGDMVIPANADQDIVSYILKQIGMDKPVTQGDLNEGDGSNVNLSNGEVVIPKDKVAAAEQAAQDIGITLSQLINAAREEQGAQEGAAAEPVEGGSYAKGIDPTGTKISSGIIPKVDFASKGIDSTNYGSPSLKTSAKLAMSKIGQFVSNNPEAVLSVGQMVAGAVGLGSVGKRPSVDVSNDYAALAARISAKRNNNVDAYAKAQDASIEAKRRMSTENAIRLAPGAAAAIAGAQAANDEWANDKNKVSATEVTMRNEGLNAEAELGSRAIAAKVDATKDKQAVYDKKVDSASKLVGTGFQNLIDQKRYNKNKQFYDNLLKSRTSDPLLDSLK